MAKRVKVVIEGGDELIKALLKTIDNANAVLVAAAKAGADKIADGANEKAPGPEIRSEIAKQKPGHIEVDIGMPRERWYWQFAETGATSHEITGAPLAFEARGETIVTGRVAHPGMPAEPFLRPAFDTRQTQAKDAVGDYIRRAVEP